jgi:hypothetical protein
MSATDLLPWLNLLLIPAIGLLMSINGRLATIEEKQRSHAARLKKLDGLEA